MHLLTSLIAVVPYLSTLFGVTHTPFMMAGADAVNAPTCSVTTTNSTPGFGVPVTIYWSSTGAVTAKDGSGSSVALHGSTAVNFRPTAATQTYSYTFTNTAGSKECSATLSLKEANILRFSQWSGSAPLQENLTMSFDSRASCTTSVVYGIDFGDATPPAALPVPVACSTGGEDVRSIAHTYTTPGAYRAMVFVASNPADLTKEGSIVGTAYINVTGSAPTTASPSAKSTTATSTNVVASTTLATGPVSTSTSATSTILSTPVLPMSLATPPTTLQYKAINVTSSWNGQFGAYQWLRSLATAQQTGANMIAITTDWYVKNASGTSIYATQNTESTSSIAQAMDDVKSHGLLLMYKPSFDGEDGTWRGKVMPSNMSAFFASYKSWIVAQAQLAQAHHADVFVVGLETDQLATTQYYSQWQDIIASVRAAYSGKIVYGANYDTVGTVAIWNLVDYIGIDPYLPLSTSTNPTAQDLTQAWTSVPTDRTLKTEFNNLSPVAYYESLSSKYHKPLFFTEIGYRSMQGTASAPGIYTSTGSVDTTLQQRLIDSLFKVWGTQSSPLSGIDFFRWSVDLPAQSSQANWATDYGIEGKPAQATLTSWYGGGYVVPQSKGRPVTIRVELSGANTAGMPTAGIVVDRMIAGTLTATSSLQANQWATQTIGANFAVNGPHSIQIYFINPGFVGTAARALAVKSVTVNGVAYSVASFISGNKLPYTPFYSGNTFVTIPITN